MTRAMRVGGGTPLFPDMNDEVRFEVHGSARGVVLVTEPACEELAMPLPVCAWLEANLKLVGKHLGLFSTESIDEQQEPGNQRPGSMVDPGCLVERRAGEVALVWTSKATTRTWNAPTADYLAALLCAERKAVRAAMKE